MKNRILLHISAISYIIDVSNKFNKNLSVIILRVDWDLNFSVLHKVGYGDKFIDMVKDVYTNIQSKIKVNDLLAQRHTFEKVKLQIPNSCNFH